MSHLDEVEHPECPLCMELLEVDDLNFFPCTCGYQICRFCWHRIRTDENGLCPACRKAYPENPAGFKPLSQEQVCLTQKAALRAVTMAILKRLGMQKVVKMKAEKRQKDLQKKQKATESRKHLSNVRVVQKNLVFVVGLPMRLADHSMLKKHDYFGRFGRILKVVINQSTTYAGATGPSASAYVTYSRCDDALRAIEAVNNICVDSRILKTSLGTTKYCSHFIKSQPCPKGDCMYLHDFGDSEASFTKEEMQQGKHQEYEKKLHEQLNLLGTVERKTSSPPQGTKTDTWPTLNINGVPTVEPDTKTVPAAAVPTEKNNGKSKRHGKEKGGQDKGKRKGKEKHDSQSETLRDHPLQSSQSETCIKSHALQTSQSESCINSQRVQSTNQANRASMIFENSNNIYSNGNTDSNTGLVLFGSSDDIIPTAVVNTPVEPSPPHTPSPPQSQQMPPPPTQQIHNGYHSNTEPLSVPPSPPRPLSTSPPPPLPNDDELGFDPFQETQKGLADLLEKELALRREAELASRQPAPSPLGLNMYNLANYQQPPPQHMDPAILSQLHSNQQHRTLDTLSRGMERRPMPPPGFAAPHPLTHTQPPPPLLHQQHELFARQPLNGTKPQQSFYYNNSLPKMVDWQENIRNLVHESTTHGPHPLLQSQHNPVNSINRQDKGWNNASSFADWTALDPAIMSTRPMGINVHSPPPNMYNPNLNLNGYGGLGGLGSLAMPNWSQRYQDAYYKTHIHNTSVPPPGFSLLHQSGSGLKPGLSSGIETMD